VARQRTRFVCQECGYETPKWLGRCPGCGEWNRFTEETVMVENGRPPLYSGKVTAAIPITEIDLAKAPRRGTGSGEFDRVLGGGLVPGSLVLVGGDPGMGKSTLLLQTSYWIAAQGKVLYVSGEESAQQIKIRAQRMGALHPNLLILPETLLERIEEQVQEIQPDCLVVDSIQTVHCSSLSSAPGSVSQVRECAARLLHIAKALGVATFIVGHVTKEGAIAGPRLLEHMVDAVLYFEGDHHHRYRVLRAVKNRFGSTNELGIFEMQDCGLVEVANPSELFLAERFRGTEGSVVVASMEGTRPILVEIQALVTPSGYGVPRRMAAGLDHHRVSLIMAVLEKRIGLHLQGHDAYVNVAGGVRLEEPAVDLGVAVSIASSFRERPVPGEDVFIGEVGLTGEVRAVSHVEQRVKEAQKLGFRRCIVPGRNMRGWAAPPGMEVVGVNTIQEAFCLSFGG
jgi:DNA repair protein RadA/Sms